MDKKSLEALAEKYQKKADKSSQMYQETGITRYGTEARNNEDLADALWMAVNAADDHATLISMRGTLSNMASRAEAAGRKDISKSDYEELVSALLRDLAAYGRMHGLI